MEKNKKIYWKGIEQLVNDPDFVKNADKEFYEELPISDAYGDNTDSDGTSRRDFLKLMGFSIAAVSLAACDTPVKHAIPYLNKPENIEPGIPNFYASTYAEGGDYCAVLVKTREGRPIHAEGNSMSSLTKGGVTARVSASVLSLYDNDKAKGPTEGGNPISWKDADAKIMAKLSGGSIAIVTNTILSPSTKRVLASFSEAFSGTEVITYDPLSCDAHLMANQAMFGKAVLPHYHFSKAKVVAGLNADFLGAWFSDVEFTKGYTENRKVSREKQEMSQHFQFESNLTITGSTADYRTPILPSEEAAVALQLYNLIAEKAGGSTVSAPAGSFEHLKTCADALWANKGASLVVSASNNKDLQMVINEINKMLGNYGSTIDMNRPSFQRQGSDAAMKQFVADLASKKYSTVIFYNCNPVYDHPMGEKIASAIGGTSLSIATNDRLNETASLCQFNLPDRNYLESWNDAEPVKGYFSLTQPCIRPVFDNRQFQDSLLTWASKEGTFLDVIKEYWKSSLYTLSGSTLSFDQFFNKVLHDGVFETSASYVSVHEGAKAVSTEATTESVAAATEGEADTVDTTSSSNLDASALTAAYKSEGGWELVVYPTVAIGNGAQANNPWLQETPDPVSKVTWGHHLAIPQGWAYAQGLTQKEGKVPVVNVKVGGVDLGGIPAIIQPGLKANTATLSLGYGREAAKAGKVAGEAGGVNAYKVLGTQGTSISYLLTKGVEVTPTGEYAQVSQTQTAQTILGRQTIIQESTFAAYKDAEAFKANRYENKIQLATSAGRTKPEDLSLWDIDADGYQTLEKERKAIDESQSTLWSTRHGSKSDMHVYANHHWGMVIDLNSCTGCSACVVACHTENNVPVVGKLEVARRREMHWMRIDRYYSSSASTDYKTLEQAAENPEIVFQPMMCQHCNNAPCETVCPVAATTHSSEGLNQMAYNRCVGTKYCANNCPFKVRRFNWFKYHTNKDFDYHMNNEIGRMVLNPDVTVRSRGVMEKCSLCVQRIQEGKLRAKKEKRKVQDGEIQVACASACPADAITFGDLNDTESKINKLLDAEFQDRAYNVLSEINVRPNVWYLSKVRNKVYPESQQAATETKSEEAAH